MKLKRPVSTEFKISSPYGSRKDPVTGEEGAFHYGIDFAVPVGTHVNAVGDAVVVFAGWQDPTNHAAGFGYRVWTRLYGPDDVFVVYGHLKEIDVKVGQQVKAGDLIGLSGNTGKTSGPHLHLEVRQGGISGVKGSPFEVE